MEKHIQMLDELLNVEDGLTEWEVNFIDDLDKRRRLRGGKLILSPKQIETLEGIWDKIMK